mgnify:FL=1
MKYRVHIEMSSGSWSQCVAYIVGGSSQGVARARAVEMARQHYPEYDGFTVYHVEELKK